MLKSTTGTAILLKNRAFRAIDFLRASSSKVYDVLVAVEFLSANCVLDIVGSAVLRWNETSFGSDAGLRF